MDDLSTTFHYLDESVSYVLLRDPWAGHSNRFNLLRHDRETDVIEIIGRELKAEHCLQLVKEDQAKAV